MYNLAPSYTHNATSVKYTTLGRRHVDRQVPELKLQGPAGDDGQLPAPVFIPESELTPGK